MSYFSKNSFRWNWRRSKYQPFLFKTHLKTFNATSWNGDRQKKQSDYTQTKNFDLSSAESCTIVKFKWSGVSLLARRKKIIRNWLTFRCIYLRILLVHVNIIVLNFLEISFLTKENCWWLHHCLVIIYKRWSKLFPLNVTYVYTCWSW